MAAALHLTRSLLDWRDQSLCAAEEAYTRCLRDIFLLLDEEIAKADAKTITLRQDAWLKTVALPLVQARIGFVRAELEAAAAAGLSSLVDAAPDFAKPDLDLKVRNTSGKLLLDFASAGVPLVAAAGALLALPSLSVTSVAVLFGLSTTAAVSMPIVAGVALATTGLAATGATRFLGLRARMDRRFGRKIKDALAITVLDDPSSHLAIFCKAIHDTCDHIIRGWRDDPATVAV